MKFDWILNLLLRNGFIWVRVLVIFLTPLPRRYFEVLDREHEHFQKARKDDERDAQYSVPSQRWKRGVCVGACISERDWQKAGKPESQTDGQTEIMSHTLMG